LTEQIRQIFAESEQTYGSPRVLMELTLGRGFRIGAQYLLGIDAGVDLSPIARVSQIVAEVAKRPVAANKPIVGTNLFEVESGIVVHVIEQMRDSPLGEIGFSPPTSSAGTLTRSSPARGPASAPPSLCLRRWECARTTRRSPRSPSA
jgi:hypothetical protein